METPLTPPTSHLDFVEEVTRIARYQLDVGPLRFRLQQHPLVWLIRTGGFHEIGHALAFIALGSPCIVTDYDTHINPAIQTTSWRGRLGLLAGPLTNLGIAALGLAAVLSLDLPGWCVGIIMGWGCMHAYVGCLNLIIYGGDGWRCWHGDSEDDTGATSRYDQFLRMATEAFGSRGTAALNHPAGIQGYQRVLQQELAFCREVTWPVYGRDPNWNLSWTRVSAWGPAATPATPPTREGPRCAQCGGFMRVGDRP